VWHPHLRLNHGCTVRAPVRFASHPIPLVRFPAALLVDLGMGRNHSRGQVARGRVVRLPHAGPGHREAETRLAKELGPGRASSVRGNFVLQEGSEDGDAGGYNSNGNLDVSPDIS